MSIFRNKPLIIVGTAIFASTIAGCGASGSNVPETTATTTATTTTAETTTATTTTTVAQATLTQETTAEETQLKPETESAYNNDNPPEAYKEIINNKYSEIRTACPDNADENDGMALGTSFLHCKDTLSYSVHDINNDGIPELMIVRLDENNVYELYTLSEDEKAVLLKESGGYRDSMWIDEGGVIYTFGSGGAGNNFISEYRLPAKGLKTTWLYEVYEDWGDFGKTVFEEEYDYVTAPEKKHTEAITQEEYENYIDKFYNRSKDFPFEAATIRHFKSIGAATGLSNDKKYANAAILPAEDPDVVWKDNYKVEVRLKNGIHIYLPSFSESFYDGLEPHGNFGWSISPDTDNWDGLEYYYFEGDKVYYGEDYFEIDYDAVTIGAHETVVNIVGKAGDNLPEDDGIHRYRKIGEKDGKVYYLDFVPPYYEGQGYVEWHDEDDSSYFNRYADMIVKTAWVE